MTELELYIKSYFGVIELDKLNKISSLFKSTIIKKGDYILTKGQRCNAFFFLQTGFLRVYALDDGKEVTQWIASKGYFGTDLSSFFYENRSRWNIQALVDTEIYEISKNEYNKIGDICYRNGTNLKKNS